MQAAAWIDGVMAHACSVRDEGTRLPDSARNPRARSMRYEGTRLPDGSEHSGLVRIGRKA